MRVPDRRIEARPHLVRSDELVPFLAEVERGLEARDDEEERFPNGGRGAAQRALEVPQRQLRLQRSAGVDEVRHRLRLHEIELAVEHRTLGELPRLGDARAVRHRPRDHLRHEQGIAVQRQLDEVITGERVRRGVADGDALVDAVETGEGGHARLGQHAAAQLPEDVTAARAVDAHDRQRAPADGCRRSHDGVERGTAAHVMLYDAPSVCPASSAGPRRMMATRL